MSARVHILEAVSEAQRAGATRTAAAQAVGVTLRSLQRWETSPRDDGRRNNRFAHSSALEQAERTEVVSIACSPEFRDRSPKQIVPALADKGRYVASESTFYRILRQAGLLVHRGKARVPERERPDELTATAPNQVWTWDISYMISFCRGVYFYLYMMVDIWDRSIVGWSVHECEAGHLGAELLNASCRQQGVRGDIVVHQDNGAPMISSEFLAALCVWGRPSYSRPGVSDDNPFSEALFRTLKYCPEYPGSFETIQHARAWSERFVDWYNNKHLHSAIGFVTPMQRRRGEDIDILAARREVYAAARQRHPERWSGAIRRWESPRAVTLNRRHGKKTGQKKAA